MMKIFTLITVLLSFSIQAQLMDQNFDHGALDESLTRPYKNNSVENQRLKSIQGVEDLADVVIIVNRAPKDSVAGAQTLKAYHYGVLVKEIAISTGKWGHATPVGYFRPIYTNHMRIYQNYFSGAYSGSPMKWAVFFNGGIALHSTTKSQYKNLGKRASHGCIRMTMEDAKEINELIRSTGSANYVMRRWQHAKHQGSQMWNEYFKGSEIEVPHIDRYTGKLASWNKKSVNTIIAVVDPR
jgi:hypothetical protein